VSTSQESRRPSFGWVALMPRVYERKFDWDEARRLREEGESYTKLGARFGVSASAIYFACNPKAYEAARVRSSAAQRSGICVVCGERCSWNRAQQTAPRCRRCAALDRTTTVEWDDHGAIGRIRCHVCHVWKDVDEFAPSQRYSGARTCRVCNTRIKRESRARPEVRERERVRDRERRRRQRLKAAA
jgi:hypothetical protein